MDGGRSKPGPETAEQDQHTPPFASMLARKGLELTRDRTRVLQINMGLICNQRCRHCHLEAGPERSETMDGKTAADIIEYAGRGGFEVIDITGGAPELHGGLPVLIARLAGLAPKIMLRSNLTVLTGDSLGPLMELCREHKVVLVVSLPSLNPGQADSQRGGGVFEKSIAGLKKLNAMGYGAPDGELQLDIVSNPAGAFLPPSQEAAEKRFRKELDARWGIAFNHLYTFGNAPLGRFRKWLIDSGNFETYMRKLTESFNGCTIPGLMCRTLVSVSWDGYLYVSRAEGPPAPGTPIAVGEHCYACTAGAGFT
jgi:radical SAM/Cys-rich protein